MEDTPSSPPQRPSYARGTVIVVAVLMLLVIGQMAVLVWGARRQQAEARAMEAEAQAAMAKAEEMVVFPLPRNPFGGARPEDLANAQIPPPPPRMQDIPGSADFAEAKAEVTQVGRSKLRSIEAAKALELAKLKEADQDMIGALKQLDDANKLEPNHPEVLYRMGIVFDKLGNKPRATRHFQAVANMGEELSGALATLATHYLNGEDPENFSGGLAQRPLSIGPAFADVMEDEKGNRTVKLALSLRAAAGEEIDPDEVKPYIYFYDLVDGLEIYLCVGEQPPFEEVNPWRSENPDYKDPEEELLDVTFNIPKIDDGANRKFFGYLVKLYYRDEIQDVLVEPRVLVELLSESDDGRELDSTLFDF
ncbi:MAG: tetratricopeptide repeat protein [Verrucomicrobiales bacterium]